MLRGYHLYILCGLGMFLAGCEAQEEDHACNEVPYDSHIALAGGTFVMGANPLYSEEGAPRSVAVAAFDVDATEITNAQFARFVAETGYVTDAEKIQPGFHAPGGAVFRMPTAENPNWWQFVEGAQWRHPEGPRSSIEDKENEPVVQVSYNDARAYAAWAQRRLPTEAEWEYAAAAGAQTTYIWGEARAPKQQEMANTWQGHFPIENTMRDGFAMRAPVGCYPPNAFGLYDMIGNVWEWTDSPVETRQGGTAHYRIKGGSFLCAPNYCRRYRAAARESQEAGLPTNHIGFRTVARK